MHTAVLFCDFCRKITDKTGLPARSASTKVPPCFYRQMAGVAQLVRAPVCGTGGRRFETGHSPHHSFFSKRNQEGDNAWHLSASRYDSAGSNGYCAGVAELVDALVLGTSGESRGGSSPSARTIGAYRYIDGVMAWRETRRRKRATRRRVLPEARV